MIILARIDPALAIGTGIVVGFTSAMLCGALAKQKGRNVVGWVAAGAAAGFIGGLCLGWIPPLILACAENRRETQARDSSLRTENRRLQEQLRQERMKIESIREHAAARLDAHDQALGMNTRELSGAGPQRQDLLLEGDIELAAPPAELWYERNGRTLGPIGVVELKMFLRRGDIDDETRVYAPELGGWRRIRDIAVLRDIL